MGVTSSKIANAAKKNMAYALINQNQSSYDYSCMGIGNGSTAASAAHNDLQGGNKYYAANVSEDYEASYKATWIHTFNASNASENGMYTTGIWEAGIFKSNTDNESYMLGRLVFDKIKLESADYVEITVKVQFEEC